jgi:hypothetical protein
LGYELREMRNQAGGTYYSLRDTNERGLEIGAGQTPGAAIKSAGKRIESNALEDALKYEGEQLAHCVGGYCEGVVQGESRIFSLRDSKGKPHATVEMQRGISNDPDLMQIKGYKNGPPSKETAPFVLDYLNSQPAINLTRNGLGDVKRMGIVDTTAIPDLQGLLPEGTPRFMSRDALNDIANKIGGIENFALGGFVKGVGKSLMDLVDKYSGAGVKKIERAAEQALRTPDAAYEPLRQRMEERGNIQYAVKPKGGNYPSSQTNEKLLGYHRLGGNLIYDPDPAKPNRFTGAQGNFIRANYPSLLEGYEEAFRATGNHNMDYGKDFWPWVQQNYPEAFEEMTSGKAPVQRLKGWAEKKLGNYIRNEMATPEDPLRLQIENFGITRNKSLAEKDAQIAKATADMEAAMAGRMTADGQPFTPEMMTRSQARIRQLKEEREFIERLTGSYMDEPTLKGSEPYYTLEVEDKRKAAGYPREGFAQQSWIDSGMNPETQRGALLAKQFEGLTDEAVSSTPAGQLVSARHFTEDNPWLAKVDPETRIYGANTTRMGFDKMLNALKDAVRYDSDLPENLRLNPEKLDKLSVPQAVELVDKINSYREGLRLSEQKRIANNASTLPFREYETTPFTGEPNEKGMRWVEIGHPEVDPNAPLPEGYKIETFTYPNSGETKYFFVDDKGARDSYGMMHDTPEEAQIAAIKHQNQPTVDEALGYEGEKLQHCVGQYGESVACNMSRIFSLRDAEGHPHATIEVNIPDRSWSPFDDMHYTEAENALTEYNQWLGEKLLADPNFPVPKTGIERYNAFARDTGRELFDEPTPILNQIKGFQNGQVSKEAEPFVQDFVLSQPWSRSEDLYNAGMSDVGNLKRRATKEDLEALKTAGMEIPSSNIMRSVDADKVADLLTQMARGRREAPKPTIDLDWEDDMPFAKGGAVNMAGGGLLRVLMEKYGQKALDLGMKEMSPGREKALMLKQELEQKGRYRDIYNKEMDQTNNPIPYDKWLEKKMREYESQPQSSGQQELFAQGGKVRAEFDPEAVDAVVNKFYEEQYG